MTGVNVWTQATIDAVRDSLTRIIRFIPNLVGAILIVIVGVVLAIIVCRVIVELFKVLKVEDAAEKTGLNPALRRAGIEATVTDVTAALAKWIVIIIFLLPASEVVGLPQVSQLLNRILFYIPNVVVAVVIVMLGTILADFVASLVRGSTALLKVRTVKLLSGIARYAIIIFAVIAALIQLGIAPELWRILLQAVVLAIVGAIILAFGLGGKDVATKIIEDFYSKYFK